MGKWKLGQIVAVETVSNLGAKTRTSRTEFPNLDTRIDVAAMQFDWEAPGRTTNSAISFGKRSTKSTNKAVNSTSSFVSNGKFAIVIVSPS